MENSTEDTIQSKCNRTLELVFWILYGGIGVVILAGNSFTFLVFVTTKRLRESYMNIFLLSLAVADVMMSAFVVPYAVFCIGCEYTSSKYCWLMAGLKDIALGGTVFNLAAISFDRFLAVIRPLRYQNDMTNTRVSFILVGVWSLSCVIALIRNTWLHTSAAEEARKIDKIYNSILTFAFALLPVLAILVMNMKIIHAIGRQRRRVHQERHTEATEKTNQETRLERIRARKGTIACVSVVFVFLVSWLPLAFVNFSFVFGRPDLVSKMLLKTSWLLLLLQSSANPFIYSFFRSEFRQAARNLICCKLLGNRTVAIEMTNRLSVTNT